VLLPSVLPPQVPITRHAADTILTHLATKTFPSTRSLLGGPDRYLAGVAPGRSRRFNDCSRVNSASTRSSWQRSATTCGASSGKPKPPSLFGAQLPDAVGVPHLGLRKFVNVLERWHRGVEIGPPLFQRRQPARCRLGQQLDSIIGADAAVYSERCYRQ
jgi:hypothetical protein